MKKIILMIICMLFLTGCDLTYEINFDYNNIDEQINATFDMNIYEFAETIDGDGFYLEKELAEEKIPSLKEYKDYYKKQIKVSGNTSDVKLSYRYNYDNFENSYLIHRCFEKAYVKNTDEFLYVSLGGNFKCFKEDDVRIKVSSKYDVIKHNANDYKDGYYIWDIKIAEDDNKVELHLSKDIQEKKKSAFSIFKTILVILFIVSGGSIFFIKKKLDNN